MKKSITMGAVLCIAGSTLDMSTIQSVTPTTHKKPSAEVVSNYIAARFYNPQKSQKDWDRSEARKQEIMSNIRSIRCQIRHKANLLQRDQTAHKLLETIACTMENKTRNRDHQLRTKRAKELHVPAKYIAVDVLRTRKGMPVIDMSTII